MQAEIDEKDTALDLAIASAGDMEAELRAKVMHLT